MGWEEEPMLNPYYSSDKLKWEVLEFNEPGLSYEYNALCFWNTGKGIYWADDSGCSCPTPFERYEGEDAASIIENLGGPVKTLAEAKAIIEEFSTRYSRKSFLSIAEVERGLETLKQWGLE